MKPVQKVEGMTNGMAAGSGQQQQQQGAGLSDISAQVQQYQQFLGERVGGVRSVNTRGNWGNTLLYHLGVYSIWYQ